jgi:hypothetical protein
MRKPQPFTFHLASGWRTEAHGAPDGTGEYLAVIPATGTSLLRLSTLDPELAGGDAAGWVRVAADVHRPRGRTVLPVDCGDFSGFVTRFLSGDRWICGWMLHACDVPLDVTFTREADSASPEDAVVDAMLNTLRLLREPA